MLNLLWAAAVVFFLLWLLGFTFHFAAGGLIHLLLVFAIIAVVARLIMGHRV